MMNQPVMLTSYRDIIRSLPPIMSLKKEQLLIDELLVTELSSLKLYYAPHNDVMYDNAKLSIVSLTPGFQQMRLALAAAQDAILEGSDDVTTCYLAKQKARFAGTMRKNLIEMLDELGIQHVLKISSCVNLFQEYTSWLNSTSIIRYPAFFHGRNYSGSQPDLMKHDRIRQYAIEHMKQQLSMSAQIPIIPLGHTVENVMRLLVEQKIIHHSQVLWGFPHPSGANGHRYRQFAEMKLAMMQQIKKWQHNGILE